MSYPKFLGNLERVSQARHTSANHLEKIAETLAKAEVKGEKASGKLSLDRDIEDIYLASANLKKGVFRLLILGDMKRGKSTFLNALIGDNLLPSDVNPCTAVLTILRYGLHKQVKVYFKGDRPPEFLDFEAFKQQYTIHPDEAKKLEQEKKLAFPEVEYAAVEYPLPLLEKGIEIVDSPGLNDTEARNELALSYINNCHAILFVLRAMQPCTLEERRYLNNYIKDRGLTVFFLVNAWDEIREALIDPDDPEELQEAQTKLRKVFHNNLAEYCQVEGRDIYEQRVFEVSSIQALRRRLKDPNANLAGTGFPEFTHALNTFLTQERAIAQMRQARSLARQAYHRVHEAIERRIPLLSRDVNELKQRIQAVEPEFNQLQAIRDRFQSEIFALRDRKAGAIAQRFHDYILNLGNTFETDFLQYQPEIGFLEFLQQGKRDEFNSAFQRAFEQYINDKVAAWELSTEQELSNAFADLGRKASYHGETYAQVTQTMTEKLIGQKISVNIGVEENTPSWSSWAAGFASLAIGNVAGLALAGAGFDWRNILLNSLAVLGIWSFLSIFSIGLITGPVSLLLLGLGVGAFQADSAKKELIRATKKEFLKYLPKIAQEQQKNVYQAVQNCFNSYEKEAIQRIDDDIKSRKSELSNLIQHKETQEINCEAELQRLNTLDSEILAEVRSLESVYEGLLAA
ncbi:MAG: dynamin [Desertifilum sp. SIO1I2]|nr:dynamin [Desertifilum sp. SIO1I2]